MLDIGILVAFVVLAYQIHLDIKSRNSERLVNEKMIVEKQKENELNQAKIYLENILPRQKELRLKIQNLRNCYANHDANLHLKWIVDSGLKFDKYQSEHIFHGRAPEDYKFYTSIYTEFKNALPEVKNLFPHSYTEYFNFINTLNPILFHTNAECPSYDEGKWVDLHQDSIKLLDEFIEKTYNTDSELRMVWKL